MLVCCAAHAQTYADHLGVGVGAFYQRGLDATLSYEHETRYHNAWEYFLNYYLKYEKDPEAGHYTTDSFWKSYNSWEVGVCYKPCVSRSRNAHGNVRLGAGIGSAIDHADDMALFSEIQGDVHVGYEHTYILRHGWNLYWQTKADVAIKGEDIFRIGVVLGLKLPLGSRR